MRDVVDAAGDRPTEAPVPDARIRRLQRLGDSRGWSFAGAVDGLAAAAGAGFEPVGQVFGTTVAFVRPAGLGNCFVPESGSARGEARTSANPYNRLLTRLKDARGLALERAVAECEALGGDGIIGMRMRSAGFFTHTVEFSVEGTAVRARSLARPESPFTTHASAQDLVRLLRSGWAPFALVFGMAIAACHYDDTMYQQTRRGVGAAANREVSGYTRIVNDARRQARKELENAVRERGGDGAVIDEATLHFSERECPLFGQRADYIVEATIIGSAVISLEPREPAAQREPLTIIRLDRRSEPAVTPEAEPAIVPRLSLGDRAFAYFKTAREAR